ncbi:MAG: LuxR C-terminal-related transcriptional regulator [Actinomycetota bacterium]
MPTVGDERAVPPDQELEVIRLIASGLKDYVIARRLEVSVVTVRRRAQSFRRRVGASTRSESIAIAAARGWLQEQR